jgi:beta-glucanase (GH16 family)
VLKGVIKGGIVEVNARLPGQWNIGGLWPAMWLLGSTERVVKSCCRLIILSLSRQPGARYLRRI